MVVDLPAAAVVVVLLVGVVAVGVAWQRAVAAETLVEVAEQQKHEVQVQLVEVV